MSWSAAPTPRAWAFASSSGRLALDEPSSVKFAPYGVLPLHDAFNMGRPPIKSTRQDLIFPVLEFDKAGSLAQSARTMNRLMFNPTRRQQDRSDIKES
jgi:hypothetical protein